MSRVKFASWKSVGRSLVVQRKTKLVVIRKLRLESRKINLGKRKFAGMSINAVDQWLSIPGP